MSGHVERIDWGVCPVTLPLGSRWLQTDCFVWTESRVRCGVDERIW